MLATKHYIAEEPTEHEENGKSFDVTSLPRVVQYLPLTVPSFTHAHTNTRIHTRSHPIGSGFTHAVTCRSYMGIPSYLPTSQGSFIICVQISIAHVSPTTTNDKCLDLAQTK